MHFICLSKTLFLKFACFCKVASINLYTYCNYLPICLSIYYISIYYIYIYIYLYIYISHLTKNSKNYGNQNFGADFCIVFFFDFEPV